MDALGTVWQNILLASCDYSHDSLHNIVILLDLGRFFDSLEEVAKEIREKWLEVSS
jgi:hypothetical protein